MDNMNEVSADDLDLDFINSLDEDSLTMFFEIIDIAVVNMSDVIIEDLSKDEIYLKSLPLNQNLQIHAYFSKLLELYIQHELYEECEDIKFILSHLERYQEIVGNTNKKP